MIRVWYDKSASDHRVWCVKYDDDDGTVMRAAKVVFFGPTQTEFKEAGHMELQPGGPRGVITTNCDVELNDSRLVIA